MNIIDILKQILLSLGGKKPAPTPPPPPAPPPTNTAAQLLTYVNNLRAANKLRALTIDPRLASAAQLHSEWMALSDTLSHNEGTDTPGDRVTAQGYAWSEVGENIADGYPTAQAVMTGWSNSPPHKAIMLNPSYTNVGFGASADTKNQLYWTADFATPSSPNAMDGLRMLCSGGL